MQSVNTILSPYELIIREIEAGNIDPFDVNIEYMIELFRKEAENLKEWEYFEEAGRFLEASAKLLKLHAESIFPAPEPRRKRITVKEVKEALNEDTDEPEYDLSWLWEHEVKVGRPAGSITSHKPKTNANITKKEIKGILVKEADYSLLAKEVRDLLKKGKFRIRSLTDFIAYLHAYMEYEDVPEIKL